MYCHKSLILPCVYVYFFMQRMRPTFRLFDNRNRIAFNSIVTTFNASGTVIGQILIIHNLITYLMELNNKLNYNFYCFFFLTN